ncbi:MAG: type II toxin-antitoxin system Phd/YefM family antitoxin [Chloroflexota bacterium]
MVTKKPTVTVVNATEAKNRFGEMIKRAYLTEEHLIIKRGGIPVVAIVPMVDYERLIPAENLPADVAEAVEQSTRQERARRRFLEYLAEAHQRTPLVAEEEVEQDIQKALREVRARP